MGCVSPPRAQRGQERCAGAHSLGQGSGPAGDRLTPVVGWLSHGDFRICDFLICDLLWSLVTRERFGAEHMQRRGGHRNTQGCPKQCGCGCEGQGGSRRGGKVRSFWVKESEMGPWCWGHEGRELAR